jgi:two-component system, NarL family, sensor kinase
MYIMPKIIMLLFALCFLCACGTANNEELVFKKPIQKPYDSLTTWIENAEHYTDKTYLPKFYKHYNALLAQQNIDSAATVLLSANSGIADNLAFDATFVQINLNFLAQYEQRLKPIVVIAIYSHLADCYSFKDDLKTSIFYCKKGLSCQAPMNYSAYVYRATLYDRLAINYKNSNNLDSAAIMSLNAIEMFKHTDHVQGLAVAYTTLADIYRYMQDYTKSIHYADLSLLNVKKTKDSLTIFMTYIENASLHNDLKDPRFGVALNAARDFYKAWKPRNNQYKIYIEGLYASNLLQEDKIVAAKKVLDTLKPLYSEAIDPFFTEYYLVALATYELKNGNAITHRDLYEQKLLAAKANKNDISTIFFYDILQQDARLRKDYKKVVEIQDSIQVVRSEMSGKGFAVQVHELDTKYQTAEKEKTIAQQENTLKQRNMWIVGLVLFVFFMILGTLTYSLLRQRRQAQKQAAQQAQFTQQLLATTEDERARIARDLHDGISHELLGLRRELSQNNAKATETNTKIDSIIEDVRQISRNLHPVMLDSIGLKLSLETLCEQFGEREALFVSYDIDYTTVLNKNTELQLFRIVQEALTNTVKYANANASKVTMHETDGKIQLTITDNGKGFDVQKRLDSGKAFGLHSIIQRAKAIDAIATIASSKNGTVINVRMG